MSDNNPFPSTHSLSNRLARLAWGLVWALLFRTSPSVMHGWRRFLLRLFGAEIGVGVHVYPSARVWAPWLLYMGDHACLGPMVDCYNVGGIRIGEFATVSQYSYLCGATHDYRERKMPLVKATIAIGPHAWIAADVFIGPGAVVKEGAVIGARSSVYKDVQAWTVVAGNPAAFIKRRELKEKNEDAG